LSTKKFENKSFILSLKKESRINEDTLNVISELRLEELIAVKLELSAKASGGKLYNFPLWHSLSEVCKDACVIFATTCCTTKRDMSNMLGVSYEYFVTNFKKYYKEE
jgi:hypothetical protein